MDIEFLKSLCDLAGVSGKEAHVRNFLSPALAPLVDRLYTDNLGNLIGVKNGSGPRIMLCSHMDEIGFAVNHISSKGFLRLVDLGGYRLDAMGGQRVIVHGERDLIGVLFRDGGWPRARDPVRQQDALRLDEFYVDLGLAKDRVESLVAVGDAVTLDQPAFEMGKAVCGKAMDGRVGLSIIIDALGKLRSHQAEICAVGLVQELVGSRGAKVAGYGLAPDWALALDVHPVLDVPGGKDHEQTSALGKGVIIKIIGPMTLADLQLVPFVRQIADENSIPYQIEATSRGDDDAAIVHKTRAGVPTLTLSIPARYTHTCLQMVHKNDLEACSKLLALVLEKAHGVGYGESRDLK